MKKLRLLFFLAFLFSSLTNHSQSLAINTSGTAADASAMLDISSVTKGLLVPRMTTVERDAIGSPANGLIIYNSSVSSLEHYNGSSWVSLSKGFVPYTGATAAVNLGAFDLKVNGLTVGLGGGSISSNTGIGHDALLVNTTGDYNSAVGTRALYSNTTGFANSATGYQALFSNTIGQSNTATGVEALYSNAGGYYNTATGRDALYSNTWGFSNTALGYQALHLNTIGNYNTANGTWALFNNASDANTANGYQALYTNTIGLWNTANGYQALFSNNDSYNTATGYRSLYANTTGYSNTANGVFSLSANTTGIWNTAIGYTALISNITGNSNTATGKGALGFNTAGSGNTATGYQALNYTTGSSNTAVGLGAGFFITTGSNNIVIGNGADINDGTFSNQVRIGNNAITYAGIQVAWTITSDSRWKADIKNSNLGLDFIKQLHPVSYYRNNDESKRTEYGFIAQEVEASLNKAGAANTGIISKDNKGMYGVRYNDFIAPMVKAIQELNAKDEAQQKQIAELKLLLEKLSEKKEAGTK